MGLNITNKQKIYIGITIAIFLLLIVAFSFLVFTTVILKKANTGAQNTSLLIPIHTLNTSLSDYYVKYNNEPTICGDNISAPLSVSSNDSNCKDTNSQTVTVDSKYKFNLVKSCIPSTSDTINFMIDHSSYKTILCNTDGSTTELVYR